MVDLHIHSRASDGTDTPDEIVQICRQQGVVAAALTDHDTVSGIEDFMKVSAQAGFYGIPGVEISTRLYDVELHIVGLFIDPESQSLKNNLEKLRNGRLERNYQIIQKLQAAGYQITEDDVYSFSTGESIGRPHIAQALIKKAYFSNVPEVFARCLKKGAKFYVPRFHLNPRESIKMIHEAGGLAVWAHPLHGAKGERAYLRKIIQKLRPQGLDGIETYYPSFTLQQQDLALKTAAEFNLLCSGGSDYHGGNRVNTRIGVGNGDLKIPAVVVENMRQRLMAR